MDAIERNVVQNAFSYEGYNRLIEELLQKDQTTGSNHSADMLHFTRMNVVRMERLDKTTRLVNIARDRVRRIDQPMIWLTLSEGWCGDAAQILPVLEKLAEDNPNIEQRLILRDQHLDIMDHFLTGKSRSIPKTLFLLPEEGYRVIGDWGPRPHMAQEIILGNLKQIRDIEVEEERKKAKQKMLTKVQKWYARDKTSSVQEEFTRALVQAWQEACNE